MKDTFLSGWANSRCVYIVLPQEVVKILLPIPRELFD